MKFVETELDSVYIIEPEPFIDNRGWFYRVFCENEFKEIGFKNKIVQINHSYTNKRGTIRGMHFQYPPAAEIKVVKCIVGSVFDVVIDLRKNSPYFLKWFGIILSAENKKMIFVPEGFAHGFQTLEDDCEIIYLHSEFYSKEFESGLRYNDPKLNIKWPLEISEISKRDKEHELINDNFDGINVLNKKY